MVIWYVRTGDVRPCDIRIGQVRTVKSSQDRSSQDMSSQVKTGKVMLEMHLRLEFGSSVGPTCWLYFPAAAYNII